MTTKYMVFTVTNSILAYIYYVWQISGGFYLHSWQVPDTINGFVGFNYF